MVDVQPVSHVDIRGPNGEFLYLGYKITYQCFIFPYAMSDDGYVLGVRGSGDASFPLDKASIEKYQADGSLPSPLPEFKISIGRYVMGHFLWVAAILLPGYVAFRRRMRRLDSELWSRARKNL
jgi:hypothetical protein